MQSDTLPVPGARLYYETRGSGPLLLLICGGNTDAGVFAPLAERLASRFTVVTYDPRGNSRSPLDGQAYDQTITEHADDAARLLTRLGASADSPAYVFGSSSGAIVGIDLITRYADLVRTLVAHEPPMVEVLPDAERWRSFFADVRETYRREGVSPAFGRFASGMGLDATQDPEPDNPQPHDPEPHDVPEEYAELAATVARMTANLDFFLAHEVWSFPAYRPDLTTLESRGDQIVWAVGRASRDALPAAPATLLADRFGTSLVDFPGDHAGYVEEPLAFADRLLEALALEPETEPAPPVT